MSRSSGVVKCNCYDLRGKEKRAIAQRRAHASILDLGSSDDGHGARSADSNEPGEFSALNRQDDLSRYGEKRKA